VRSAAARRGLSAAYRRDDSEGDIVHGAFSRLYTEATPTRAAAAAIRICAHGRRA